MLTHTVCVCLHVTSDDDVVFSGGQSASPLVVSSVSASRHSSILEPDVRIPSHHRRQTPWPQEAAVLADDDSDRELQDEVVVKLIRNETTREGASSHVIDANLTTVIRYICITYVEQVIPADARVTRDSSACMMAADGHLG